ncbi:uncharacterized protein LOC135372508 [Ornithodoros turicata]|uniref:uncharacterized protein LOC135372508 n=1 Tax=Ornithodoros turicata TaxID=34597 RepID=UPI003139B137
MASGQGPRLHIACQLHLAEDVENALDSFASMDGAVIVLKIVAPIQERSIQSIGKQCPLDNLCAGYAMELKRRQCPLESVARVPRTTGCTRHSPCAGHWTTFCGRTGAEFSRNHEVRSFQKSIQFLQSVATCSLAWTLSVLPWMDNHRRVFLEERAKMLESHACFVPLGHDVELRA